MLLLRVVDSDKPTNCVWVHGWVQLSNKMQRKLQELREREEEGVEEGKVEKEGEATIDVHTLQQIIDCMNERMGAAFSPASYAAYLLNPEIRDVVQYCSPTHLEGFQQYARHVYEGKANKDELVSNAMLELAKFHRKTGVFSNEQSIDAARRVSFQANEKTMIMYTPVDWWYSFGSASSALFPLAIR